MSRRRRSALSLLAVLPLLPLTVAPADARSQADAAADAVRLEARGAGTPVAAGDRVAVRVRLVHGERFHTWPHEPVVPPALEGVEPVPAGAPPGARRLELIVRFQPCDERVCYRPRTAAATVELEVPGGG